MPDTFLASGDVAGFNAALPTKGSRSVREVFSETRVPLIKGVPLIESLSLNGAFRNSDYNLRGVGDVWTYSAGADWKLDGNFSFRGQYQRAIRAPNVGELFGGQTQNFTAFPDPCGNQAGAAKQTAAVRAICLAQGVPAGAVFTAGVQPSNLVGNVSGGNPNLSAEQSETLAFGSVITPEFVRAGVERRLPASASTAIAQLGQRSGQHRQPLLLHARGRRQHLLQSLQPRSQHRRHRARCMSD